MTDAGRALVVGVGNRMRGDDAAGPLVADALGARGFDAVEHAGDGAALIELWAGRDRVVVVDAMRSGAPPGTIRRLDAAREALPSGLFHASSHAFGVAEAVETARALGRLPASLVVYGIEGRAFAHGTGPAAAISAAVDVVARRVADELGVAPVRRPAEEKG